MVRQISGVIAGYFIFVVSSLALFKFSGIEPHATAPLQIMVLTAIYGAGFSFLSGIISQYISNTNTLKTNYILALILAGFATFSYFKASGSHWTQLLAIFIFAPASILGGWFYLKRKSK